MTRKMKNSRLGWAGMIPKEWICNKAKFHVRINNGSDPKAEGDVPVYGSGNKSFRTCGEYKLGPAVLLGRKGSISNPRYIEGKFWNVDTAFDASVISNDLLPKYYYYLAQNFDYARYVTQTTLPSMTQTDYRNMKIPVPPVEEQQNIIAFIDKISTNIDATISLHQQIIEKLEEYRKSVITQAVTKGLNPNVEMKDSGTHLLGNIPADWVMKRLRNVAAIVRGGSPRPIDQYITDGDGYNWIKIGDATGNGKYITSTKQKIIKEGLSKTRIVNPGTLLLTNSMSFGHPYILQITGCIHDGWLAFSDYREMIPEYLYYYLMAEPTMVQFKSSVDGSVVQNLNIDKVKNAIIVCPSLTEQKAIVSYLDTVGGQVDESIKKHAEIIEKLKEYKQSIIYNAVTGKIDCRVTE